MTKFLLVLIPLSTLVFLSYSILPVEAIATSSTSTVSSSPTTTSEVLTPTTSSGTPPASGSTTPQVEITSSASTTTATSSVTTKTASSSQATLPASTGTTTPTTDSSISTTTPTTTDTISSSSSVTVVIRDGDTTIFSGEVLLPSTGTSTILVTPTYASTSIAILANSALAILTTLDAYTDAFTISDLTYYSSYDSFLINCITSPVIVNSPACYNWTYAVNNTFPYVGVDDYLLQHGDTLYLFFGPQRKATLSTSTTSISTPFTATALRYELDTGIYMPVAGLGLGVGIANADYTFTELATSTTDIHGEATFILQATGTFSIGITEDYYYPNVPITITATSSTNSTSTTEVTHNNGSSGGKKIQKQQFSTPAALTYLTSLQATNGSFSTSVYTDWTALAFASANPGDPKNKLYDFLTQNTPNLANITDYERHAMALMALNINPYNGTSIDYITPIVDAFDGNQIGDQFLDNDDIFALFPLLQAGFTTNDTIIKNTTSFIISKQKQNGSWDNSIDMTAAAIQALYSVQSIDGSPSAITKGIEYLRTTQEIDGGWGNIDSTSWVITALHTVGENEDNWKIDSTTYPSTALANAQQTDGGVRSTSTNSGTRNWSTSYAVVAASDKSWIDLLSSFTQPAIPSRETSHPNNTQQNTTSSSTYANNLPKVLGIATSSHQSLQTDSSSSKETRHASVTLLEKSEKSLPKLNIEKNTHSFTFLNTSHEADVQPSNLPQVTSSTVSTHTKPIDTKTNPRKKWLLLIPLFGIAFITFVYKK